MTHTNKQEILAEISELFALPEPKTMIHRLEQMVAKELNFILNLAQEEFPNSPHLVDVTYKQNEDGSRVTNIGYLDKKGVYRLAPLGTL